MASTATKSKLPRAVSSKPSSVCGSVESLATTVTITSDSGASSIDMSVKSRSTGIPKSSLNARMLPCESVDEFSIDEKVWVNGSRPGFVRFIGDTKFAPGKWIGVQLTSADGKNDGTVGGIRYFQCLPNCGVFVKPQRLTKAPVPDSVFQQRLASEKNLSAFGGLVSPTPKCIASSDTDSVVSEGTSTTSSSVLKSPFQEGDKMMSKKSIANLKLGDRVLVNASSGAKYGTLMFLGETDFAAGQWAGIELDDPVGKNDGSVAGKRYFECKTKYGLFAPLHKISTVGVSSAVSMNKLKPAGSLTSGFSSKASSVTRLTGPSGGGGTSRMSRVESTESVNSTTSSVSRQSRSGVRLGVTALKTASPQPSSLGTIGAMGSSNVTVAQSANATPSAAKNTTAKTIAGTNAAILDALKEKDEHINQLLRERDLDRGEFSRVAMQADELEERIASLQAENARIATEADEEIGELKRLNCEYEEVQLKLSAQLEDERRKGDDLQFRYEEESIAKTDLETMVGELKKQIDDLRNKLESESAAAAVSVSESDLHNSKLASEQLSKRIKELEADIQAKEAEITKRDEDIRKKDEALFQLGATTEKRNNEFKGIQLRVQEIEQELEKSTLRSQKYIETIDELNQKLSKMESESGALKTERNNLMAEISDYENRIFTLEEKLIEEVTLAKETAAADSPALLKLQAELDRKVAAEKMLQEKLEESKQRQAKVETEINNLADQIRDLRRSNEDEGRRRKTAEEKVVQLQQNNESLNSKLEDLMQKSGDNSHLLTKLNSELLSKEAEFSRREKQLEREIETILKEQQTRENQIRNLRIDIENQKSVISRFEKTEKDVEKLVQAKENELKLAQSLCDEKERQNGQLKTQLKEVENRISTLNKSQEFNKGEFETQIQNFTKDLTESRKKIEALNEEIRKYKTSIAEIETERDQFQHDIARLSRAQEEKERTIEKLALELTTVKEKLDDYSKRMELELEGTKDSGSAIESLTNELDQIRSVCKQNEAENETLKEDNRQLSTKVEQLKDDIEGIKRRHAEILNEFEEECKRTESRALAAEALADGRLEDLADLERKQNRALLEYRQMAETEKALMEQKLDDLEHSIREQKAAIAPKITEVKAFSGDDVNNYEQQIEFLNSVIVDMQKKNDELANRVNVLEEIGLGEFEHSFQNQMETTPHHTARVSQPARKFCDICLFFDQHETEDCPQQASGPASLGHRLPGHTYNAVDRTVSRAYCDLCEKFGHESDNCAENETF